MRREEPASGRTGRLREDCWRLGGGGWQAPPPRLPSLSLFSSQSSGTALATYTLSSDAQSCLSIESASRCRRASSEPTSCPGRESNRGETWAGQFLRRTRLCEPLPGGSRHSPKVARRRPFPERRIPAGGLKFRPARPVAPHLLPTPTVPRSARPLPEARAQVERKQDPARAPCQASWYPPTRLANHKLGKTMSCIDWWVCPSASESGYSDWFRARLSRLQRGIARAPRIRERRSQRTLGSQGRKVPRRNGCAGTTRRHLPRRWPCLVRAACPAALTPTSRSQPDCPFRCARRTFKPC